jgi:hypothetical protein
MGKPAAAVLVMAAIIAVLFVLCTPRSTSRASAPLRVAPVRWSASAPNDRSTVRVLFLDVDPTIQDSPRAWTT